MTQLRHNLYCNRTGIQLGHIDLALTAGHIPYISHWNEMICYHPLFSLTQSRLIEFMQSEWRRLAKDVVNHQTSDRESTILQVGFVALLHNLGSIKQDRGIIGLPELTTVQHNLESLLALSGWHSYLARICRS